VADFKGGKIQVLVATYDLLAEGFNHRPLNRLFLATPIRWEGLVVQSIGRVQRPYEGKTEALVYDYMDEGIAMFADQASSRLSRVYERMGMPIVER
jgi:superfamily II DNA or RNA helicase